jgi:hypothetical protein
MEVAKIKDFLGGWFIGNFEPSLYKTNDVEIGIKYYKSGDREGHHHHKIATEFTAIISGKVLMDGQIYESGEIIMIKPNISTNFEAITDTVTVVVKIPGANNDKYVDK